MLSRGAEEVQGTEIFLGNKLSLLWVALEMMDEKIMNYSFETRLVTSNMIKVF